MTDTTSSSTPQNLSDSPARPPVGFDLAFFTVRINFLAFCVAIVLTIVGVKLSSYLPELMYFSFSRALDTSKKPSPFLIQPSYLSRDEVCKAIEQNKDLKSLRCDAPEESPEQAQQTPEQEQQAQATITREKELADRYIREQAQKGDFLRGIFGLGIRLAIPCLAGFLVVRLFSAGEINAGALGAGAGALLLCWPVILLWDYVVTKEWRDFYAQFLALYTLYVIMFFYMGRLGGMLSAALRMPSLALNYGKIIETVTVTVVGGVLTKFLEAILIAPK